MPVFGGIGGGSKSSRSYGGGTSTKTTHSTQTGTNRQYGGSNTKSFGSSSSAGSRTGNTRESWTALPEVVARINSLLGQADKIFLGGPAQQAQGGITAAGNEGLLNRLEERAAGVLGAGDRSPQLRQFAADDIQRRVNQTAGMYGRTGSAAHQGVLGRELSRFSHEWDDAQHNRDIASLSAGGNAAMTAQNLRLNPTTQYAQTLSALGQLGGVRTGQSDERTRQDTQTRSQQEMTNFSNSFNKMITDAIEKSKWNTWSKTRGKNSSWELGVDFRDGGGGGGGYK